MENKFKWTDWNCEGCRQYKMLKKRKSDGKMLCRKCSKNNCLKMFTNENVRDSVLKNAMEQSEESIERKITPSKEKEKQ